MERFSYKPAGRVRVFLDNRRVLGWSLWQRRKRQVVLDGYSLDIEHAKRLEAHLRALAIPAFVCPSIEDQDAFSIAVWRKDRRRALATLANSATHPHAYRRAEMSSEEPRPVSRQMRSGALDGRGRPCQSRLMIDDEAARRAAVVYAEINDRTRQRGDFAEDDLEQSRQYFDLSTPDLRTRSFDVLTTLAGLPTPSALQESLTVARQELLSELPRGIRVYQVRPELLHWESHIIRRPGEPKPSRDMVEIVRLFRDSVTGAAPFDITYRGFFVASDGTIAFQGFGATGELRSRLRSALPFSSPRQNDTGHISVARILDPIGGDAYRRLLERQSDAENRIYGTMRVAELKLVRERRWYMEDYDVIAVVPLGVG